MKTLLLIRHAKSSWNDQKQPDFERTLTDSGKSDAKIMAGRIKEGSIQLNFFVSSPAIRAITTAKIFMKELEANENYLLPKALLYEATVQDFYRVIESLEEKENEVAVFAHNPGITDFINSLECFPVYNMPMCAVYALKVKTNNWSEFRYSEKEFLFFDYPESGD